MIFGEAAQNRSAHWQSPPNSRGSMTILSSCYTTLILCIWTAVHLNVPEHVIKKPRPWWHPRGWMTMQQWRKVKWLVIGLLAPEMIAFTAWAQRRQAYILSEELEKLWAIEKQNQMSVRARLTRNGSREGDIELASVPETQQNRTRNHPWTMTHSLYAVMGGFAFDTSNLPEEEKFLPGSRDRVTLSPDAVLNLARLEPSLLPDISIDVIKDKSNASGLAKGIVCFQATWFLIQVITRLCQRRPISLLELNTFAHALCALLIYFLWWNKPLDVNEPTIIDDKQMHRLCASFCHESKFDDVKDCKRLQFDTWDRGSYPIPSRLKEAIRTKLSLQPLHKRGDILECGQKIGYFSASGRYYNSSLERQYPHYYIYYPRDKRRWRLARPNDKPSEQIDYNFPHKVEANNLLVDRKRNFPSDLQHTDPREVIIFIAISLAGLGYGALHLIGWEAPFASHWEKILWRASGISIIVFGPILICLFKAGDNLKYLGLAGSCSRDPDAEDVGVLLVIYLVCLIALLYILARVYLVVECFISLAYLPEAVFEQPSWTFYFPHIS